MVGQEHITNLLLNVSLESLPQTILLVGDKGCGKHLLVNELALKHGLDIKDITDTLTTDNINEIQISSLDCFYIISLNEITEKEQNVILKFIEEPSKNSHVILIADSVRGILDTIINRCQVFKFRPYTEEELKIFLSEGQPDSMLKYCRTPGQIKNTRNNIDKLVEICGDFVNRVHKVALYHTLNIADKYINFKDEYDKYEVDIFMRVLLDVCYEVYSSTGDSRAFKIYTITNSYYEKLKDSRINRKILLYNMLTDIWRKLYGTERA